MKGPHINIMGLVGIVGGGLPIYNHNPKPWIQETKLRSGWHILERNEPTRAEKKAAATKGLPLQFRKLSTKPVKKAAKK